MCFIVECVWCGSVTVWNVSCYWVVKGAEFQLFGGKVERGCFWNLQRCLGREIGSEAEVRSVARVRFTHVKFGGGVFFFFNNSFKYYLFKWNDVMRRARRKEITLFLFKIIFKKNGKKENMMKAQRSRNPGVGVGRRRQVTVRDQVHRKALVSKCLNFALLSMSTAWGCFRFQLHHFDEIRNQL